MQKMPYLIFPGAVIAGFWAAFAAWWVERPSWIVPATILWAIIGVICAWCVLRKYGLPASATMGDLGRAMQKEKNLKSSKDE